MRALKSRTPGRLSLNSETHLLRQGDMKALESIYRSYCGLVRSICMRMLRDPFEAEDAAQDVFVRVLCKMHTFRGEAAFSSWLYRLTTNVVLMKFRKHKHCVSLDDEDCLAVTEMALWNHHLNSPLARIELQTAIDILPKGYRSAFILHHVQGYDHKEIAEILGCSVGTSKSQSHRARRRLRQLLGGSSGKEYGGQITKD